MARNLFLCVLTPFDPNGSNTTGLMSDAQLVIDVLIQQGLPQPLPSGYQPSDAFHSLWIYVGVQVRAPSAVRIALVYE